jgi:hypothetical protein
MLQKFERPGTSGRCQASRQFPRQKHERLEYKPKTAELFKGAARFARFRRHRSADFYRGQVRSDAPPRDRRCRRGWSGRAGTMTGMLTDDMWRQLRALGGCSMAVPAVLMLTMQPAERTPSPPRPAVNGSAPDAVPAAVPPQAEAPAVDSTTPLPHVAAPPSAPNTPLRKSSSM